MEDGTDTFTDTVITRVAAVCGEKKKKGYFDLEPVDLKVLTGHSGWICES